MLVPEGLQEGPLPFGDRDSRCREAERVAFDYCRLLSPTGASGRAAAGDRILQRGMLELVHQPVPVLRGRVMHTGTAYTARSARLRVQYLLRC